VLPAIIGGGWSGPPGPPHAVGIRESNPVPPRVPGRPATHEPPGKAAGTLGIPAVNNNKHVSKISLETLLNSVSNDLLPFMVRQSHDSFTLLVVSDANDLLPFMVGQIHDSFTLQNV
jgi:hypothetical protein